MRLATTALALLVTPAARADALPGPKEPILTCATPRIKNAIPASLTKHFGADQVSTEAVPGPADTVAGEGPFASNLPAMRQAKPKVVSFGVGIAQGE